MKIRTSEVPARNLDYLTVNREYEVRDFMTSSFGDSGGRITLDEGVEGFILLNSCSFLDGRDWEVVPE